MRATDGIFRSLIRRAPAAKAVSRCRRSSSVRSFPSRPLVMFVFVRRANGRTDDRAAGNAAARRNGRSHVACGHCRPRVYGKTVGVFLGVDRHDAARCGRVFISGSPRRGLAGLAARDWLHCDVAPRDAHGTAAVGASPFVGHRVGRESRTCSPAVHALPHGRRKGRDSRNPHRRIHGR